MRCPRQRLERKEYFRREKLMNKRRLLIIIGIVVVVVVLVILFTTILANHRPAIAGLEAPERVVPNGKCEIMCIASDRDGDALSYNWSATGGNISGIGAAVNWTAPEEVGSHNVTVTVTDSRGGEAIDYVTIEVRANTPPTISSLVADADWTLPSGNLQVTCTASDPDGDDLNYEWTATTGNISGTGPIVNWTAPEEVGIYSVTVVVKDRHGSSATSLLPVSVATEQPPTIENLIVTPKGHIYLRKCTATGCDYDVWKGREYDIACNVSDTSGGVIYAWSCDGGQISGEGSAITWTAPDKTLTKATVTVIVCEDVNKCVAKNIVFYVPSCSCGSWG
jgi:hypothetical protein